MKKIAAFVLAVLIVSSPAVAVCETDGLTLPREFVIQERPSLSAEDMIVIFEACTGYEGTAGCSLKEAIAALRIADYALGCALGDAPSDTLEEAVGFAYNALPEELRTELGFNMQGIDALLDRALRDYPTVQGLFDDAGIEAEMRAMIAQGDDWRRHWKALMETFIAVTAVTE